MTTEAEPASVDHYYGVLVEVPPRAPCPHGEGTTTAAMFGVRIACPEGRDCWFLKWQWQPT